MRLVEVVVGSGHKDEVSMGSGAALGVDGASIGEEFAAHGGEGGVGGFGCLVGERREFWVRVVGEARVVRVGRGGVERHGDWSCRAITCFC